MHNLSYYKKYSDSVLSIFKVWSIKIKEDVIFKMPRKLFNGIIIEVEYEFIN